MTPTVSPSLCGQAPTLRQPEECGVGSKTSPPHPLEACKAQQQSLLKRSRLSIHCSPGRPAASTIRAVPHPTPRLAVEVSTTSSETGAHSKSSGCGRAVILVAHLSPIAYRLWPLKKDIVS